MKKKMLSINPQILKDENNKAIAVYLTTKDYNSLVQELERMRKVVYEKTKDIKSSEEKLIKLIRSKSTK